MCAWELEGHSFSILFANKERIGRGEVGVEPYLLISYHAMLCYANMKTCQVQFPFSRGAPVGQF